MNLFNWIYRTRVTWAGWQFGVLKWCQVALGVILGAAFADFWKPYLWLVGLVFVATAVWAGVMYFRGMSRPGRAVTTPERQESPC